MVENKAIIGNDPNFLKVITLAHRVSQHDIPVVILGETGTGKELLAREIHNVSPRRNRPFVVYDCTTSPDSLSESELFGIDEKVATGVNKRNGIIESTDGGTLFLDEIGDMPLNQQAKLLRVLEDHMVSKIGKRLTPDKIDFRLLVATNQNLYELIEEKKFRKDLFYRIKGVSIYLPPLRERKDDIPRLVHHFLIKHDASEKQISHDAMRKLKAHNWPGNIRELDKIIYQASLFCEGEIISPKDIRFDIFQKDLGPLKKLLNKRQQLVYNYIHGNNMITNRTARSLLKASRKTINRDLADMVKWGLIKKDGEGRGISYKFSGYG